MQELHFGGEMLSSQRVKQPLVQPNKNSICVSRKMLLTVGVLVAVFALGMLVSGAINSAGQKKLVTKSRAEAGPIDKGIAQTSNELPVRERFPKEKGWTSSDLSFIRIFRAGIAAKANSQTYDKTRVEDWMWKHSTDEDVGYSYFNGLVHMKHGLEYEEVPQYGSGEFKFQECSPNNILTDTLFSTFRCAPYNFSIAYTDNPSQLRNNYEPVPEVLYVNIYKRVADFSPRKIGSGFRNIWTSFKLPKDEIRVLVIPNSEDPNDQIEQNFDGVRFNTNPVQVVLSTVPFGDLTD